MLFRSKADVVVGVDQEVADKLDAEGDRKWRFDGQQVSPSPSHHSLNSHHTFILHQVCVDILRTQVCIDNAS